MIHLINLHFNSTKKNIQPLIKLNKQVVNCDEILNKTNSFTIEIEFDYEIISFRNFDYTWQNCKSDSIATEFCSKVVLLKNGVYVQPNIQIGIWQFKKKYPKKLCWTFNQINSKPLTFYTGTTNEKIIAQASSEIEFLENPTLLFVTKPIEFSRSAIPFSAVACFTDHCDFDTLQNLALQRQFFNKHKIKITKGFFLNHFSKRDDNASYQKGVVELDLWKNDGHEMCYHSLSQSIKSETESFNDFENFTPPYSESKTWIDHGYQPYNFSLYQNFKKSNQYFETNVSAKNIENLWNYIDSGTATIGVINQLNPNHFTLSKFFKGTKNLKIVKRIQLMIKNIIFHYYADESIILNYKNTATHFKKIVYNTSLKSVPKFIKAIFSIGIPILKVVFFWKKHKNIPYKLAKYCPIFFTHTIFKKQFYIFQTVEMVDFIKSLSPNNINLLIEEKGLFIAHTYFSVPMNYHQGKMFINETTIDDKVENNFSYLSSKIQEELIWNPTLQQLINYLQEFDKVILDIDVNGNAILKTNSNLIFRTINT